VLEDEEAI
jgi:hypothetical protein